MNVRCAKRFRQGTFMNVIEIDAASNNGVDNIRENPVRRLHTGLQKVITRFND